jgi:hypothetical protein
VRDKAVLTWGLILRLEFCHYGYEQNGAEQESDSET